MNEASVTPHARPAVDGVEWLADGFKFFRQSPGAWMLTMVVGLMLAILLSITPVIGQLASALTTYIWTAGLMLGCHAVAQGEQFDLKYLFAGFRSPHLTQLLVLSGGTSLLTGALTLLVMGEENLALIAAGQNQQLSPDQAFTLMVRMLVLMLVTLPVIMAAWFAAPLIALNGLGVLQACRLSIQACRLNIASMLVYGLVLLVMFVLAIMTMGIGFLVAMPMFYASIYSAYRRIFHTTEQFYF